MQQARRLGVGQEQCVVHAHFVFDLRIVGQDIAAHLGVAQHLPGRLALGGAVVGAVLGDHARGGGGDFGAQQFESEE